MTGQTPQKTPPASVAGIPVNYDEALAGTYTLPDPLILADGKAVRDPETWNEKRRPEIVRLFEENQFGRSPGRPDRQFQDALPPAGGHLAEEERHVVPQHFQVGVLGVVILGDGAVSHAAGVVSAVTAHLQAGVRPRAGRDHPGW